MAALKRAAIASTVLAFSLALAAPAPADPSEYAISSAGAELDRRLAGDHADLTLSFTFVRGPDARIPAATRDLEIELPPGLIANPLAVPVCGEPELTDVTVGCPIASQVGIVEIATEDGPAISPLYSVRPIPGALARLGFVVRGFPLLVDAHLRTEDFGLTASVLGAPSALRLSAATITLWGVPAAPEHDPLRLTPDEAANGLGPQTPTGTRPSPLAPLPFMTNPSRCGESLAVTFRATSYQRPLEPVSASASLPVLGGCGSLRFSPGLALLPTAGAARRPTGMTARLSMPVAGFEQPARSLDARPRRLAVALPSGFGLNPAAAAGIQACPLDLVRIYSEVAHSCPGESKLGVAEASTPLLPAPLHGSLYLAEPFENPFATRFAAYLVLAGKGLRLKLPLRLDLDESGRLVASLGEIPPLPFSELSLRFWEGPHAPLTTPDTCTDSSAHFSFLAWSGAELAGNAPLPTLEGCAPSATPPSLLAGTLSNGAATTSTLQLRLENPADAPNLSALAVRFPPGLSADLAAVRPCADSQIPDCPADSRIGYAQLALGSGPDPLQVPAAPSPEASVFLAGPYRGAPYSLLVALPAIAGPFDFGELQLRGAIDIDPGTAQISVSLDRLPQALAGIPLRYRTLRLVLDRPGFIHNPTSCSAGAVTALATDSEGQRSQLASRFQAADCAALPFEPKVSLRLSGPLGRGAHPRVSLRLSARGREANLAAATFTLPPGELLDTRRITSLCPRDLAPGRCPPASRLGRAMLSSPLLPEPLAGPVYLRRPSRRYPDLLAELHGGGLAIRIHGRTGSAPGGRLRISLLGLPDIPFSQAEITLAGARHGIFVTSEALCGRRLGAQATLTAHNAKQRHLRPRLRLEGRCGATH